MRYDIAQQLTDYRGVLGWNAVGGKWPAIEIPLYIKDHPLPLRRPKVTEINTAPLNDPVSGYELSTQTIFFGSPDLLQISITGWMITPKSNNQFSPKDISGAALSVGNISYPELVMAFIEGRMNISATGAFNRKDPDYYVTPYGHRYNSPIISAFDASYSPTMKKQTFNMTLLLEK